MMSTIALFRNATIKINDLPYLAAEARISTLNIDIVGKVPSAQAAINSSLSPKSQHKSTPASQSTQSYLKTRTYGGVPIVSTTAYVAREDVYDAHLLKIRKWPLLGY